MYFRQVIGQEKAKQQFLHAHREARVPHAQLIVAAAGTGGLPMAMAMAQYLLCEHPGETEACGECPACQKTSRLIHPDLHMTFPVIKPEGQTEPPVSTQFLTQWREAVQAQPYMSEYDWLQYIKADNKTGNITAKECREIISRLGLKAYEGHAKVQVLWMAEQLGKEGNILLKLIEEPPPDSYLILVAEDEEQVLATIQSRCQTVRLEPLSDDQITEVLQQQFPDSAEEEIHTATLLADGSFNTARQLLLNPASAFRDWLRQYLIVCHKRQMPELLAWIDDVSKAGREVQKAFLMYAVRYFRECLLMAFQPERLARLMEDQLAGAEYLAQELSFDMFEQLIIRMENLHYYIGRNANPKVQWLDTSLDCMDLIRKKVPAYISRDVA